MLICPLCLLSCHRNSTEKVWPPVPYFFPSLFPVIQPQAEQFHFSQLLVMWQVLQILNYILQSFAEHTPIYLWLFCTVKPRGGPNTPVMTSSYGAERKDHIPWSVENALSHAVVGLLCCEDVELDHVQFVVFEDPEVLFFKAAFLLLQGYCPPVSANGPSKWQHNHVLYEQLPSCLYHLQTWWNCTLTPHPDH